MPTTGEHRLMVLKLNDKMRKVIAFSLTCVVSLSVYVTVIHAVNAFGSKDLLRSFALKSLKKSFSNMFEIGDALIVEAESELADTYELTIYEDSSIVLVDRGEFSGAKAVVEVALNPPVFNAEDVYVAVFDVHAFDDPVPGVYFSDSATSVFEVVGVATRLRLEADYDGTIGSLYLNANLTDVDGYPIANETVDFSLQFANRRRLTEGWVPLSSAETDKSGRAKLSLAFGLAKGNYSVKAYHRENENFGESENVTDIEIFFKHNH